MRVLLVDLEARHPLFKAPSWTPVYLPSLAAVLREGGHQAAMLERAAFEPFGGKGHQAAVARRFGDLIAGFAPETLAFDVQAENWGIFRRLVRAAREATPATLLLAGGRHATLCPGETLAFCPELDAVLIGEAETTISSIAGGAAPAVVSGIALRRGNKTIRTAEPALLQDLDALPMPAWNLLDMAYYTRRTPRVIPCLPLRTASIESSRGCAGQCTFCAEGRMHARVHRFHGAEYVCETVERLIRDYSIEGLYFRDENFLANPGRVAALCEAFVRRGLSNRVQWAAQVRPDSVSPGILRLMRTAGCVQLEYGIESGSQRILDAIGKGTSVEQNADAIRITREAEIRSLAYTMFGLPGETRDDLLATESFLERSGPDVVRFTAFTLYPGAPAVTLLEKQGRLAPGFWKDAESAPASSGPDGMNVSAMTSAELRRTAGRVYRSQVFPRFLRDFRTHNRMRDVPGYFNIAAAASHFLKRLLR